MSSARSSLSHRQDVPLTDETTTTPRPLALGEVLGDEKKAPPSRRNELQVQYYGGRYDLVVSSLEDHLFRTGAPPNDTLELFLFQLGQVEPDKWPLELARPCVLAASVPSVRRGRDLLAV